MHNNPTEPLTRFEQVFLQGFIATLLITWSPFNALAYLAPFLFWGWLLLAAPNRRMQIRSLVWLLSWAGVVILHGLVNPDLAWFNSLLSFVTYSSFALFFVIPSQELHNPKLFERMLRWIAILVIVQAVWGIVQAVFGYTQTGSFDLANGDYVDGTIHPPLEPELTFSNVMFAANMSFSLLALLPSVLKRKYLPAFILGVISLVLASVVHLLIFLFASLLVTFGLVFPWQKTRLTPWIIGGAILVTVLVAVLLPNNMKSTQNIVNEFMAQKTPRAIAIKESFTTLPAEYPQMPWIGLGPGQFSSRAGLIATGFYFGGWDNPRPLPLVPTTVTPYQECHLMELWRWHGTVPYWASSQKPFLSWLSLYTEFGVLAVGAVLFLAGRALWQLRQHSKALKWHAPTAAGFAALLFLLFSGLQENYWEVPQVILIGVLLIKVLHANSRHQSPAEVTQPALTADSG